LGQVTSAATIPQADKRQGICVHNPANMVSLHGFRHKLRGKRNYLPLVLAVFAAMGGLAVGRKFLGSVSVVAGCSMAPTFEEGSRVYTAPISGSVNRGDVVVMDDGREDYAIKRIVGLPGETVYLWRGYVFIDRKILLEPYVPKRVYTLPRQRLAVFELGPSQYFVLGDNRPNSADSRLYGPVERKQIKKRIPLPDGTGRAHFGPVRLPPFGKTQPYRAPVLGKCPIFDHPDLDTDA
jgi:signal peptidase I